MTVIIIGVLLVIIGLLMPRSKVKGIQITLTPDMTEAELTAAMEQLGKLYSQIGDIIRERRNGPLPNCLSCGCGYCSGCHNAEYGSKPWHPRAPESIRKMDKADRVQRERDKYDDWDNGLVG